MKKIFAISILFLYLLVCSGLTINAHFCGKQLSSVSIDFKGDKSCGCGDKKMADNCCKNNQQQLKLTNNHQPVSTTKINTQILTNLFFLNTPSLYLFRTEEVQTYFIAADYSPPKEPSYILHGVLII